MGTFSAGSITLISALRSGYRQTLKSDLENFLFSLDEDLKKKPWWKDKETGDNKWVFKSWSDEKAGEIYISKLEWAVNENDFKIMIGVQEFIPEALFMNSIEQSMLYIWVLDTKKYRGEGEEIGAKLVLGKMYNYGKPKMNLPGGYLVKEPISRYITDPIEQFDVIMRKQIVAFMDYFASSL
jgi:hypothetical protein